MSNDVIDQVRRYLEYAAQERSEGTETSLLLPAPPKLPWYRRGPMVAGLAALLVFLVFIPVLLNVSRTDSPPSTGPPSPLAVGVDYVWPQGGYVGDPDEIAAAFAREALGWSDFTTSNTDPAATADGPVWTRIDHPEHEDIDVLSVPTSDGRRVLMQVGSGGFAIRPAEDGPGQVIRFPVVSGAIGAFLHVRFVDPDTVEVFEASKSQAENGSLRIGEEATVGGIVLVYVDESDQSITAIGAHFGPIEDESILENHARVGIPDSNMAVTYPAAWHIADETLTPVLGLEVFSVGSFPLRAGGPNCAQVPTHALHDMGPSDVFVTLQERGSGSVQDGFDPRPDRFGPIPGSTDNVFYECLDEAERADIGAIHWIWFSDQDRYFHVLVAIGVDASAEDNAAVWGVLDRMKIEPDS